MARLIGNMQGWAMLNSFRESCLTFLLEFTQPKATLYPSPVNVSWRSAYIFEVWKASLPKAQPTSPAPVEVYICFLSLPIQAAHLPERCSARRIYVFIHGLTEPPPVPSAL